ncbi:MAG: cytidine deaminase [Bacteroidales bacterium]|nr:cytidine deaminase [Bacteroidales bacterium]
MKEFTLTCTFTSYKSADELPDADLELMNEATKASNDAYAPYSKFRVGAALRLGNGKIICGNNQENVAYPSGLCAERVALFYASATYPNEIVESIAVTAQTDEFKISDPVTPCGSCRQVLAESEKKQNTNIRIIMKGAEGEVYVTESAQCLLPLMFRADKLKK